jgi:hypothetical protein
MTKLSTNKKKGLMRLQHGGAKNSAVMVRLATAQKLLKNTQLT